MHLEGLEEQVRLVAHTLLQALELGPVEVVCEDGLVVGVRALVDNNTSTLARRQTTDVSKTLQTLVSHHYGG
jgi:hypothetical protein